MTNEMEDCPFCHDFKPFTASRKAKSGVYVGTAGCAMCGASIMGTADTYEGSVRKAIEAWNTRKKAVEND